MRDRRLQSGRTLAVAAAALGLALITACQKPTPGVTLQSGSRVVRADATLYIRDGKETRSTGAVKVLRVRAGALVGIDVDGQLADHGWAVHITPREANATTLDSPNLKGQHRFSFDVGSVATDIVVSEAGTGSSPAGLWAFQLQPTLAVSGRVLVVTAVAAEADALAVALGADDVTQIGPYAARANAEVTVLIAGVGPAAAAAATSAALALASVGEQYALVVSAGIGGGIAGRAALGEVVEATTIVAADLGVQTVDGFQSVAELGFGTDRIEASPLAIPGAVRGPIFTVSTVTGTERRATELAERGGVAEAMEGFGVAIAASRFAVPVAEIRAISNAVGLRQRERWDIPGALAALAGVAGALTI